MELPYKVFRTIYSDSDYNAPLFVVTYPLKQKMEKRNVFHCVVYVDLDVVRDIEESYFTPTAFLSFFCNYLSVTIIEPQMVSYCQDN